MNTVPWQPGFTWRKLGFVTNSNSLAYRDVLSYNPGWDVITEPPIGAVIRLASTGSAGGTEGIPTSVSSSVQLSSAVYPFESVSAYVRALSKYSPSSMMNVDRFNGWSMDSLPAVTGIQ